MATKTVSITINGEEAAIGQLAKRIVNQLDNHANWANLNLPGQVNGLSAMTNDVTVVSTSQSFAKDAAGNLVVKVKPAKVNP